MVPRSEWSSRTQASQPTLHVHVLFACFPPFSTRLLVRVPSLSLHQNLDFSLLLARLKSRVSRFKGFLKLPSFAMTSKSTKKAAASIDEQGEAAASATKDAITPVPEDTGTVAPSPAVVTRSQTRAASKSPRKFMCSPKKLAASHKPALVSASASAPIRGVQETVSPSYQDVVMDGAGADSPINVDEGEPPRSGANRRLEDTLVEVKGTPSYKPPPPAAQDAWFVVFARATGPPGSS